MGRDSALRCTEVLQYYEELALLQLAKLNVLFEFFDPMNMKRTFR